MTGGSIVPRMYVGSADLGLFPSALLRSGIGAFFVLSNAHLHEPVPFEDSEQLLLGLNLLTRALSPVTPGVSAQGIPPAPENARAGRQPV